MTDNVVPLERPTPESIVIPLVEDMLEHARELHAVLRKEGDKNDIKDRITSLKYLEEVIKSYFILKKQATNDPAAAGSSVRKYAGAFSAKNAVGGGKKGRGRPKAEPDDDGDGGEDDSTA